MLGFYVLSCFIGLLVILFIFIFFVPYYLVALVVGGCYKGAMFLSECKLPFWVIFNSGV